MKTLFILYLVFEGALTEDEDKVGQYLEYSVCIDAAVEMQEASRDDPEHGGGEMQFICLRKEVQK